MAKRTVHGLVLGAFGLLLAAEAQAQTVSDIAARGACSTAGLEGISKQLAETQMCLRPGAFVEFAPHPGITLTSNRVHPYLQASARDALWAAAASVPIRVNSAFRTLADQYVLYYSGGCGLAARPGASNHQSGRAVDVDSYASVRGALESAGCAWFGSDDPVHFDCPGTDGRADAVLAMQRLWNINHPEDPLDEDGDYGPATEARLAQAPAAGFPLGGCALDTAHQAEFVAQGSSLEVDASGATHFVSCAGQAVDFWFSLRNVSDLPWTDGGSAEGESVRLGSVGEVSDPFTGETRRSLNDSSNPQVEPAGGECLDAGCRQVRFDFAGQAPSAPGVYQTRWQLVDEGRAWFGPEVWLDIQVEECGASGAGGSSLGGAGGLAGAGGGAGVGGAGGSAGPGTVTRSGSSCAVVGAPPAGPPIGAALGLLALGGLWRRRRSVQR